MTRFPKNSNKRNISAVDWGGCDFANGKISWLQHALPEASIERAVFVVVDVVVVLEYKETGN
jgi:hypothetical protein